MYIHIWAYIYSFIHCYTYIHTYAYIDTLINFTNIHHSCHVAMSPLHVKEHGLFCMWLLYNRLMKCNGSRTVHGLCLFLSWTISFVTEIECFKVGLRVAISRDTDWSLKVSMTTYDCMGCLLKMFLRCRYRKKKRRNGLICGKNSSGTYICEFLAPSLVVLSFYCTCDL